MSKQRSSVRWLALPAALVLAGCAPRFVDLPATPTVPVLVERPIAVRDGVLGTRLERQPVLASTRGDARALTPFERVRWLSSTEADTRLQASPRQSVGRPFTGIADRGSVRARSAVTGQTADVVMFELDEDWQITPQAGHTTMSFQANPAARYRVEFRFAGELDPVAAHETTVTWNALAKRLIARGAIRGEQITLASAHYQQPENAIVLIPVD
jgi:hypothetical protein